MGYRLVIFIIIIIIIINLLYVNKKLGCLDDLTIEQAMRCI